jgi:tellurium resistance protein TerD
MAVTLAKGSSVSLAKVAASPDLTSITVGLGWSGVDDSYDLDASAIIVGANRKALSDDDFIFYNNLTSPTGALEHQGDELVGGDGMEDDEQIVVNLQKVPSEASSIVFIVSIDQARERGQSFGQIANAFIRVVNNDDGKELARFSLTDGASSDIAIVFGEVYENAGDWQFRAIGEGDPGGLLGIVRRFGINAS